jgi:hypothetical protein
MCLKSLKGNMKLSLIEFLEVIGNTIEKYSKIIFQLVVIYSDTNNNIIVRLIFCFTY